MTRGLFLNPIVTFILPEHMSSPVAFSGVRVDLFLVFCVLFCRTLLVFLFSFRHWVRSLDLTTHTRLSPIRRGFAPGFVNYEKGCTRLAAASDKVYQLLAHGRWFCPGTQASSTTKTGRHDIAEILLKVPLNTINQSNKIFWHCVVCPSIYGFWLHLWYLHILHYYACPSKCSLNKGI